MFLPAELRHRSVRIYQPTRNTMQCGQDKGTRWRIDFDILQGGGRWENPLMGWASSYVLFFHVLKANNGADDDASFACSVRTICKVLVCPLGPRKMPCTLRRSKVSMLFLSPTASSCCSSLHDIRLGLLCPTTDSEAHSSQELRRELSV